MKRQKRMPLILLLFAFLLLFLVIQAIRSIKVYIVYSSGILPFFIAGLLLAAMMFLYFKR
nr:hypothetical protein [uncultured Bacillus sp.]